MFQRDLVEKIKTHFLFNFFLNHAVYEIMWKKYCRAGQVTDDKYGACALHAGCLRLPCWLTKVTNTHSEYVIPLAHGNSGYANTPECCFIRALPVMSINKVLLTSFP